MRALGSSQAFPGQHCVPWLVITVKLLPEPRTAGLPVNVQSHLSMARYPAGQGSGERHSCSFAGLTKALCFCWLNIFSGAGVWGQGQAASPSAHRLSNSTCRVVVHQTQQILIYTHTYMLLFCRLLCLTYCILIYFIVFQIKIFQVGTRPVGLAHH